MLEEIPNWYRVRLSDGKEGYISAAYAQKKQ
jgi:SH3-like domain-containing protein